jgi:lysine 2,3-aminomutase
MPGAGSRSRRQQWRWAMLEVDPEESLHPPSIEILTGARRPGRIPEMPGAGPVRSAPPTAARPRRREVFPIGPTTRSFMRRFFPDVGRDERNDWRWQARARLRTLAALERIFVLSPDERRAVERHEGSLPLGITPYYASLMDREDPSDGLRRTHIPTGDEYLKSPGEADDPLGEDSHSPVPGLVHRYPDRVLFLTTGFCSTYCRYCTRSRMVGGAGGEYHFSTAQWERALGYIEAHPEVRDVLVSGGDPLTLGDEKLDWLLGRLQAIRHVEFIRIGTKVPVVLPQRITRALVRMLRRRRPIWMSLHLTHPSELTPEVTEAFGRLADAGIPLGSQTVLLKGVNDSVDVLKPLFHGLLRRRVRPYYLFQCDPITGSAHFRTPVEKGLEILRGLRGHTTGYAVPAFVIDAPGGGGKVQLVPDHLVGRNGDDLVFRNFEGKLYTYPDPDGRLAAGRAAEAA